MSDRIGLGIRDRLAAAGALPVDAAIPELLNALTEHSGAVLVADPGAGKTTRVPLFLLDEPWLGGRRIVMLEPRRLAARSAARRMAFLLGERVGETVGYRVRGETRSGPATRIEVVTEGVLTRMLQADPALEGVGIVIFDEFHERSLHADLGLALCLETRDVLREDLRLLAMSATMEAEPVAHLLGDVPVVRSSGRSYPVTTRYLERRSDAPLERLVERAVRRALEETGGDVLVFLPGVREIRRVAEYLSDLSARGFLIAPLHGGLSHEEQDRALAPAPQGGRKVVLSTSVAETSLTVEGIQVVIDSGWARVSRFSPRTGMSRLETVRVSRASADQRRGRAGRLGPGVCYRLWTEQEEALLPLRNKPEILETDLVPLALELAVWGAADPYRLRWLDPPPKAALSQAIDVLRGLGALDERGGVTARGRRMAEFGIHPRLGRMILCAASLGHGSEACHLAALLEERDVLAGGGGAFDPDVRTRLALVASGEGARLRLPAESAARGAARGRSAPGVAAADESSTGGYTPEGEKPWPTRDTVAGERSLADRDSVRRIRAEALRLMERAGVRRPANGAESGGEAAIEACGLLLAFAFPERIAQHRGGGRYLLRSGRGASFPAPCSLAGEPYVVAVELDDKGADGRILLAAPVSLGDIEKHFAGEIEIEDLVAWDGETKSVAARRRTRLGALVLREQPLADPDPHTVLNALLAGIAQEGLGILPWTKAARALQQRLVFMRRFRPDWPDASDASLLASLKEWLAPYLGGMRSASDLQRLDLASILSGMLSWEQRRELDAWAPSHFVAPSGSRIPIDYSEPAAPAVAVRLQELFGLGETPRIARGQVPLRLHLLSPAHRPVQVTQDLASFWRDAYFEVRKELKGRYPKHYWPDDPLTAPPQSLKRQALKNQ